MESTVVNGRVPAAKKEKGTEILQSLGATTTDLINSAYDYLLERKELPAAKKNRRSKKELEAFIRASTLDIDWGSSPEMVDYKQILIEGKRRDYESLDRH